MMNPDIDRYWQLAEAKDILEEAAQLITDATQGTNMETLAQSHVIATIKTLIDDAIPGNVQSLIDGLDIDEF